MCWHIPNDMGDNDASSLMLQLYDILAVVVSLWSRFFCFLLGSSPHVSEISPGTSVNYIGNAFHSNQEEPLCTRGQYVTPDDRSGSYLQTVALQELPFHQTVSKLPTLSKSEIHLLLLPCLDSFTVAYWLLLSSLLGRISSGLMHLKRNKGLGGSQASFSPLLTGTAHFITPHLPLKLPRTKHWPYSNALHKKQEDSSSFPSEWPPLIHWFGLTVSWTFCLLKLLKETLMLPADCSPLLCVDSLFLTVSAELTWCCFICMKKLSLFFFFFNENGTFRCSAHCWLSSVQQSQFHLPIYSSSKFYKWSANAKANLIRFNVPQEFSSYLHFSETNFSLTYQ